MMLKRKAWSQFEKWRTSHTDQAMLVTGARQVGKSYLVERFAHEKYSNVVKFDLIDQRDVLTALNAAHSSRELFMALSAFAGAPMIPGEENVAHIKNLCQQSCEIHFPCCIDRGRMLGPAMVEEIEGSCI